MQKRRKIQIECWHRQTLLPDECDDSLQLEAAEDCKKKRDEVEKQHREKERRTKRLALQFKDCLGGHCEECVHRAWVIDSSREPPHRAYPHQQGRGASPAAVHM